MNAEALELTKQFQAATEPGTLTAIADAIIRACDPDENGELSEESIARLDALNLTLAQKAEAYAVVYNQLTTEACANKELVGVYEKRAKARRNTAERLKKRLYDEMMRLGVKELGGHAMRACVEWSPHSVDVLDVNALPEEYKTTHVEVKVERKRLIDALKAGAQIAAARLTRGSHLRFR